MSGVMGGYIFFFVGGEGIIFRVGELAGMIFFGWGRGFIFVLEVNGGTFFRLFSLYLLPAESILWGLRC